MVYNIGISESTTLMIDWQTWHVIQQVVVSGISMILEVLAGVGVFFFVHQAIPVRSLFWNIASASREVACKKGRCGVFHAISIQSGCYGKNDTITDDASPTERGLQRKSMQREVASESMTSRQKMNCLRRMNSSAPESYRGEKKNVVKGAYSFRCKETSGQVCHYLERFSYGMPLCYAGFGCSLSLCQWTSHC